MISVLSSHIKILRPLNVFISGLAMLVGAAILGELHNLSVVIRTVVVVMCYTAAANVFNDFVDYEIDLINRPSRPIPSGKVNKKVALILAVILFCIGSITCLELTQGAQVIAIIFSMPLMVYYSTHLKGMPIIGNIIIALILGLSFLFCGEAHNNIRPMLIPMILAFGLTLVRELIKDIADMEGDSLLGLKTFPITAGINNAVRLTIILSFIIGLASLIPFIMGTYNVWYGILLFLGVEIPLGVVVASLIIKPGISSAIRGAGLLKFSTLMGLVAIYIGTL